MIKCNPYRSHHTLEVIPHSNRQIVIQCVDNIYISSIDLCCVTLTPFHHKMIIEYTNLVSDNSNLNKIGGQGTNHTLLTRINITYAFRKS